MSAVGDPIWGNKRTFVCFYVLSFILSEVVYEQRGGPPRLSHTRRNTVSSLK